ncbi:MAG: DUF4382 domain-containing protein [Agriterribacter sp.]
MKVMKTATCLFIMAAFFASCSKSDNNSSSMLHVRLTDAPGDYDSVNIDLREIRIKSNSDASDEGWQTLETNAGIYDLLSYQNGNDTLVAKGLIDLKNIQQIRLVLGDRNTIVAEGVSYPLTIPSGAESGLKIMLNKVIAQPADTVILDFDALLSIKEENDSFKLRPVITVK